MIIQPKAIVIGLVCLIALSAPFYLIFALELSIGELIIKIFVWLQYVILFFSGVVTAYFARNNELANGVALGIVTALLAGIFSYIWPLLGLPSDSIGFKGSVFVAVLMLPITIFLSSAGAICIRLWRRKRYRAQ